MKGLFLGIPVQVLDLATIVQCLEEYEFDEVYLELVRLFITEPFVVINSDRKVIFFPEDEEEIYDFLEMIYEKFNFNNEEEVEP
jgi:hypothetical protein